MVRIINFAVASGTCVIAVLMIAQVFCRYVLNASLTWTEEVSTFLMIWVGMLGVALLARQDEFIGFTMLKTARRRGLRVFSRAVSAASTLIFAGLLAYYGLYQSFLRPFSPLSSAAEIPMAWVYAIFPIAGSLIVVFLLLRLRPGRSGDE